MVKKNIIYIFFIDWSRNNFKKIFFGKNKEMCLSLNGHISIFY